eukprot:CAMPEP_0183372824 /NCGR_PEP_ID=MMETSP0164_2-20130417/109593_1 /TAXON_ID=221442 /ORGANISM="Coccolithus pelagicus ssp braarudi, Strain PLY182g" /LENGTH=153 /DNA_ID=CAMNT_0025549593 /DNA_START=212 /DNA_END=674 /DNA_ORIENTATION=-
MDGCTFPPGQSCKRCASVAPPSLSPRTWPLQQLHTSLTVVRLCERRVLRCLQQHDDEDGPKDRRAEHLAEECVRLADTHAQSCELRRQRAREDEPAPADEKSHRVGDEVAFDLLPVPALPSSICLPLEPEPEAASQTMPQQVSNNADPPFLRQ